jgi:hypothetical protein
MPADLTEWPLWQERLSVSVVQCLRGVAYRSLLEKSARRRQSLSGYRKVQSGDQDDSHPLGRTGAYETARQRDWLQQNGVPLFGRSCSTLHCGGSCLLRTAICWKTSLRQNWYRCINSLITFGHCVNFCFKLWNIGTFYRYLYLILIYFIHNALNYSAVCNNMFHLNSNGWSRPLIYKAL